MQTFKKEERLNSKKLIEKLFNEGESFKAYPLRIIWLETDNAVNSPASLLISVSSKKFKKAVLRNLMKRRIREAFRKNKQTFYSFLEKNHRKCVMAVLLISVKPATYKEIEEKIIYCFERLQKEYENSDR